MTFWDRLSELMNEKKLSQRDMEEITGLKQPSISRWQFGTLPKADVAIKIASYFNVSVRFLIEGGEREPYQISPWRDMGLISENQDKNIVNIPFFKDTKVSAGLGYENPIYAEMEEIPVLKHFIGQHNPNKVRMLEVTGDSMIDIHMYAGDLVFFIPIDNPSDGLNIVCVEDKLYVKRIEFDIMGQEIKIISENEKYPPKVLKGEDMNRLRIIGKVIGWITRHPY